MSEEGHSRRISDFSRHEDGDHDGKLGDRDRDRGRGVCVRARGARVWDYEEIASPHLNDREGVSGRYASLAQQENNNIHARFPAMGVEGIQDSATEFGGGRPDVTTVHEMGTRDDGMTVTRERHADSTPTCVVSTETWAA